MSNLMSSLMSDSGGMTDAQMMSLAMQMQNQRRADAALGCDGVRARGEYFGKHGDVESCACQLE